MTRYPVLNSVGVFDKAGRVRPRYRGNGAPDFVPDGRFTVLGKDGTVRLEITYRAGVPHGPCVEYWCEGGVSGEGRFENGRQHGIWHYYWPDGRLYEIIEYREGKGDVILHYSRNGEVMDVREFLRLLKFRKRKRRKREE